MLSMHNPEKDPAALLREQLARIAEESAVRQRVADAENAAAVEELNVGTRAVLDGLARTTEEARQLPKLDKEDPGPPPPRLSDINPFQ
jgi:hypothetical protein